MYAWRRWRARRRQMAPRHWPTSACTCRCNCKLWGVLSVYSHTQLSSGHTRRYAMHATLHTQLKLVHQQFILHNCTTHGSMQGHVMDAVYRVLCDRVASSIPRHQWLYLNNCSNTQQSVSQSGPTSRTAGLGTVSGLPINNCARLRRLVKLCAHSATYTIHQKQAA